MGFKKNNPGCGCCGCTCIYCSGIAPTTLTLTASGWISAINCSDCSGMNSAFAFTCSDLCKWTRPDTNVSCGSGTIVLSDMVLSIAALSAFPGNVAWLLNFTMAKSGTSSAWEFYWDSGGTVAFDCTITRTLTYNYASSPIAICDGRPATWQLVA